MYIVRQFKSQKTVKEGAESQDESNSITESKSSPKRP